MPAPRPEGPGPEATTTVSGHVLNEEQQPIEGVTVSVAGAPETFATTNVEGVFEIALEPGLRTLYFQKLGFATQGRDVLVAADAPTTLDIILAIIPPEFPYASQEMRDGFLGLDVGAPVAAFPAGRTVDPHNERSSFRFATKPGLVTMLSGIRWDHAGPLSAGRLAQGVTDGATSLGYTEGPSPLVLRVDDWSHEVGNATLTVRVPPSKLENPQETVVVAYQQRFEVHVSFHHYAPATPDATPFP